MLGAIYNLNGYLKYNHKICSVTPALFKTREKLKTSMNKFGYKGINPCGGTFDFMGSIKAVSIF